MYNETSEEYYNFTYEEKIPILSDNLVPNSLDWACLTSILWLQVQENKQENQQCISEVQMLKDCWATGKDFIEVKNCIAGVGI